MKILYGITKSNFGGAQRYVLDLALASKEAGHDVSVICGGEGELVSKLKEINVRTITLPYLKRDISLRDEWRSFKFILKTLAKENPEVFHTNSAKMGGLGNLAGRLAGIRKIIFTGHGFAFNEKRSLSEKILIKFFTWLTILLSHQTICVSKRIQKDVSNWPFISSKLILVHNGIQQFELLPRTDSSFTVGTLAELHHIKGLDILLQAWQKFRETSEGKLVIMGTGEEKENLEMLAQKLGILDSVKFKGFVDNARTHLKEFDVFVLPSRSEGLPYTILEAGLAGLPVIATRVGGIPEVIEDRINGILVNPENKAELFSALALLSKDTNLRKNLGEKLKETVSQKFSLAKMARETLSVYLR